jgi:transketolase
MRNAFAEEITQLGGSDRRIVLLSGDIGNRLFDKYKLDNQERFINCGVAEANMIGVAAGMALSGLRPVIYTITPFTTTRCYEQIRNDICYHNVPVLIVGTGSGLSYAELGPTHHSCEDLAIMRVLPSMTVLAPCDSVELRSLLRAAFNHDGPIYMRIGKKGEPIIHSNPTPPITIGRAVCVREGKDVCLLAAGTIMSEVVQAADRLTEKGISTQILSFHTVKPLDTSRLLASFSNFPLVGIVEEHNRIGGLASSVAEWLADHRGTLADMISFGVDDEFMHEVGNQSYARSKYGIDAQTIASRLIDALDR